MTKITHFSSEPIQNRASLSQMGSEPPFDSRQHLIEALQDRKGEGYWNAR